MKRGTKHGCRKKLATNGRTNILRRALRLLAVLRLLKGLGFPRALYYNLMGSTYVRVLNAGLKSTALDSFAYSGMC